MARNHEAILNSLLWVEGTHATIFVWLTLVGLSTRRGRVGATRSDLARLSGVTVDEVDEAIAFLCAEHPMAEHVHHGGRYLEARPDGWQILLPASSPVMRATRFCIPGLRYEFGFLEIREDREAECRM